MDEYQDDHADEAERAFKVLSDEVSVLCRAVEALSAAWDAARARDLSIELGRLVKGLTGIEGQLGTMNKHPALTMTPADYSEAIARAGESATREAVRKLDQATRETKQERFELDRLVGTVRTRKQQRDWLMYVGSAAVVLGWLSSPFMLASLPFGLNSDVATFIIGGERWAAGASLMQTASPAGWNNIVAATNLVRTNEKKIDACTDAATKARKDQRCTITVPAGPHG